MNMFLFIAGLVGVNRASNTQAQQAIAAAALSVGLFRLTEMRKD